MELIRGIAHLQEKHRHAVLTIGNFDGVHLGHQALLKQLKALSRQYHCPSMVMIFEPQPLEFFMNKEAPARITSFRDKYRYLADSGIDYVLLISFNESFSQYSATKFIEHILVDKLAITGLLVGNDFCFGRKREGDITLLEQYANQKDFWLTKINEVTLTDKRISSTLIRETFAKGDFAQIAAYLGRPYSISGRVIHGQKLARTLGAPTANLRFSAIKAPLHGVFAVQVRTVEKEFWGVANLGYRPTVSGQRFAIEVHLFGTHDNLYGQHIEVIFFKKMRDEVKFGSLDALKAQIMQDIIATKQFFNLND